MIGTTWVFWAIWSAAGVFIVAGIVLLYLGLFHDRSHGRRRCPRCAYDLSGTPKIMTCSECGYAAGDPDDFFRTRKSRPLVGAGIICLIFGFAPAVWHYGQKIDWIRHAPVRVLAWIAVDDSSNTLAAREELVRRVREQAISDRRTRSLAARVLDWQADPETPWFASTGYDRGLLGDIIEAADDRGLITDEQFERFIRQAFDQPVEIRSRDRVRSGPHLSLRASQPRPRLTSRWSQSNHSGTRYLRVVGQVIHIDTCDVPDGAYMPIISLADSRAGLTFASFVVPCELPPGEHELTVRLDFALRDIDYENPWWGPDTRIHNIDEFQDIRHRWQREATVSLTVVDEDEDIVERYADERMGETIRDALDVNFAVDHVTVDGMKRHLPASASGVVIVKPLPIAVSFDVIGRANGREVNLGGFTSSENRTVPTIVPLHNTGFRTQFPDHSEIDVVFRTNVALAERSYDIERIWDGQIVIEGVPLTAQEAQPDE